MGWQGCMEHTRYLMDLSRPEVPVIGQVAFIIRG